MQIIWKGHSFFQILTNPGKDAQVVLAIDPFSESIGLKPSQFSADVLLVSHNHEDHNNVKTISGNPFLIQGPGEYEIKGVYIQGIPAFHDNNLGKERGGTTIFTIETEEIKVCHLGDFGQKELFPEQLEDIGEVDILLLPVGGNYTIDAGQAAKIVSQIEPKIVVPMHYQVPKLNLKLDGVDKFLKAMGQKTQEPLPKLTIKKKDLDGEETKVVVLKFS
jgi:L-ascorbate metabolism protein UlaG (beta-lactamase superfamily)